MPLETHGKLATWELNPVCVLTTERHQGQSQNQKLSLQLLSRNIQNIFNQTLEAQIVHSSRNASSYYGFISDENERKEIYFIVKVKATLSQMYLNHLVLSRIFNYKYTKFGSRKD